MIKLPTSLRFGLGGVGLAVLASCIAPAEPPPPPVPTARPVPARAPAPAPTPRGPATFVYSGELTQGGWLRGQAPGGTVSARLDGQALSLDADGVADLARTAEPWGAWRTPVWIVGRRARAWFDETQVRGWKFQPVLAPGTRLHAEHTQRWQDVLGRLEEAGASITA